MWPKHLTRKPDDVTISAVVSERVAKVLALEALEDGRSRSRLIARILEKAVAEIEARNAGYAEPP